MHKSLLMTAAITLTMGLIAQAWSAPFGLANVEATDNASNKQDFWSNDKQSSCPTLPAAESTKLGIIRQMLTSGKPHAALAYLDAARITAPQSELLRADGLRHTGREDEAVRLYRKLLDSCVAGHSYQGLGLIASKSGNISEAVELLRSASATLPIDPAIRNDYGYALLLANDTEAALHEFLTAIELAPGNRQAAHNLILLLYRTGQEEKIRQVADQLNIAETVLAHLRGQSKQPLAVNMDNAALKPSAVSEASTSAASAEHQEVLEVQ